MPRLPIPLDFIPHCSQIARHEDRQHDLHYLLHHYPLSIAGGAVFFIPNFHHPKSPLPARECVWFEESLWRRATENCGSTTR
jgi:hypothetical protein